jgi:hypothetical protein
MKRFLTAWARAEILGIGVVVVALLVIAALTH